MFMCSANWSSVINLDLFWKQSFLIIHKHYNYLQWKLEWKVFTKVIKMRSCETWVKRDLVVQLKETGAAQMLKSKVVELDNYLWERINIINECLLCSVASTLV
jgi:hypothetical protein